MSRAPYRSNSVPNAGDYHYPPQSGQNHASAPGVSTFIDGSGPIFSMYLERAKEEDEKMAENWKADADGILIFTGLFSASVASLITVSIQDIQPNSQDTSNFYLANIYEAIADPNRANISTPSSPPPFSPPNYAVWVNTLWFLSLVISITCALLATLLQQWARRYLKVTQPRYSLHKRARVRSFFAEGVEKSVLPLVVEALPTLLHLSLFLFFSGLVVFLWNVDLTIFKLVLSWVCACSALYGCTTVIPFFRRDSPYYTPLTQVVRLLAVVTLNTFIFLRTYLKLLLRCCAPRLPPSCFFCCSVFWRISRSDRSWFGEVLELILKTPEEAALESPSEIVTRAFMWTFDSLDEDHELDRFFSSLPGFRSSKVVEDPLPSLTEIEKGKLFETLSKFLDLTFSSDLLPEPVKIQRAIMCAKACDIAEFSQRSGDRLYRNVIRFCYFGPQNPDFVPVASDSRTEHTAFVQAIATTVVARPQQRDDSWFRQVAPNALGIPETVLREYAANGDSLSLAILIHITRQHFSHFQYSSWPEYFYMVLKANSTFNAQDTSPELQHEFCALWNQIVLKAQNDHSDNTVWILQPIRHIYITLHHNTDSAPTQFSASTRDWDDILDSPSSYPVCQVAGHVHNDSSSAPYAQTVLYDTPVLAPAPLSSLGTPSSSIPAQPHVIGSTTDVRSLDNLHPSQTSTDGLRFPVTSAGISTASVIRDVNGLGITTTPHPTAETSTSTPFFSSPPPTAVALRHNANLLKLSDQPNLSSGTSNPVLDNMLPSEFHPPIVTIPPCASLGMTFSPGPGAAASLEPGLSKEGVFDPPSASRAIDVNTTGSLDLPPLAPSLHPVTNSDVAIVGHSLRETDAEYTADCPSDPLHQYDIV